MRRCWQPDGLLLAVAAGRQVRLWDGAKRQWRPDTLSLPGSVQALSWSPDGLQLAASCHKEVAIWRPTTPLADEPWRAPTGSAGLALAFSPMGRIAGQRPNGSFAAVMACGRPCSPLAVQWLSGQGAGLAWSDQSSRFATTAGRRLWRQRRSLETTGQKLNRVGSPNP